jgi:hypothetical protein
MLSMAIADIRKLMDRDQTNELPMWEIAKRLNTVMGASDWVQAVRQCVQADRSAILTRSLELNGIEFVIDGEPLNRLSDQRHLNRITVRRTKGKG